MVVAHYLKLVFEALTIEHFDSETMGHNILAYKLAQSWLWQGGILAYYTFHPFYTGQSWLCFDRPILCLTIVFLFALTELMSLLSNIHLQNIEQYKVLHPKCNPMLLIPQYHGFAKVSCANYFWKLCSLALLALVNNTFVGTINVVWLFIELSQKAHRIHYQYVSKYREKYPANRMALIPYLI